jgi:hypothetical protein
MADEKIYQENIGLYLWAENLSMRGDTCISGKKTVSREMTMTENPPIFIMHNRRRQLWKEKY